MGLVDIQQLLEQGIALLLIRFDARLDPEAPDITDGMVGRRFFLFAFAGFTQVPVAVKGPRGRHRRFPACGPGRQ